jgi:hypothetical protein
MFGIRKKSGLKWRLKSFNVRAKPLAFMLTEALKSGTDVLECRVLPRISSPISFAINVIDELSLVSFGAHHVDIWRDLGLEDVSMY